MGGSDEPGLRVVLSALRTIKNFRGITVAIPHKVPAAALLDRVTPRALAAGAVNVVKLDGGALVGDIADGAGFVRGVERAGFAMKGKNAWLVGVGGSGTAIAAALAEAGVARLHLSEAVPGRAEQVAVRLAKYFPEVEVSISTDRPARIDLAINATPLGMLASDPLPFDPRLFADDVLVCDIVMQPPDTALLRAAQVLGLRCHAGQSMLDCQLALYLDFFGIPFTDESALIAVSRSA